MGSTEQHYSLRWNDYTVKIVTAFQSLRDEEDFVDVTVACDGHHYSAHKMVLSACSPYFRSLLRANPCQHPIVILKDVGHIEMERLLEFMYNGEVNIAQDQLAAFLKTAENLKIRGLAGSSEDMDQLHKDGAHNYTNISGTNNSGGGASGKNSPSAAFGSNQTSKEEESNLDGSISYHTRGESPPSKRRKRTNVPTTSHCDSNAASHASDGLVSDGGVDMEGSIVSGGGVNMEEDLRLIDRREMKPEPTDPMADVYSETSDLGTDAHQGDPLDPRQPVMYPLAMPGPSGASVVSSQDNMNSQEAGAAPGGAVCEALNLSLRPTSNMTLTNGSLLPPTPVSIQHLHQQHHHHLHHQLHQPTSSVATAVISRNSSLDDGDLIDKKPQFIELVYPDVGFSLAPHPEKVGAIDRDGASNTNQILDSVAVSAGVLEYKAKTYPCQECHKVFRHPMSLHHHRHVHKGTYTCDSCGKVFSRRWDLHRHIHRSKMGCRRPNSMSNSVHTGQMQHCADFTLDLNHPPSN